METPELITPRLILRAWRESDREPFARMNADPRVMEFYPQTMNRVESDALVERIEAHFERHGFGLWAVEVPTVAEFVGFVGLAVPRFEAAFTPCVEVGWRLGAEWWGYGYATEGARAAVRHGFEAVGLKEILSFTVPGNARSRAVMERLGMTRNEADDFDHPVLSEGHRAAAARALSAGRALSGIRKRNSQAAAPQTETHGARRSPSTPEHLGCSHRLHRPKNRWSRW